MKNILILLCFVLIQGRLFATDEKSILKEKLKKEFPGIVIMEKTSTKDFQFSLELNIQQFLDHNNPQLGSFPQTIYLYHKGFKKPNVLVTEGYNIGDRIYEASQILNANQFSIEYRFHGNSTPKNIPWNLLTSSQEMEDLHFIKTKLAKIYKKNWTVTGISKGGTTAALYALTYPKDMNATVAYVAPFILAQEDPRTIEHYTKKVNTEECRNMVLQFQRAMLQHRNELVPMINDLAKMDKVSFLIGADRVLEYASMEFPFSFWQWGFTCKDLPSINSSAKDIYDFVEQVVDFNYYDDKTVNSFAPSFYQFMSEFGYYGFDTTGLSDLIIYEKHPTNLSFCPEGVSISYNPNYMKLMTEKASNDGKNIIYIYGALDTWYSCHVTLNPNTNCKMFVKSDMGHRVKIRNFSTEQKDEIYSLLKKWTKSKTKPLPY
ncbi:MAG: S28 family serine protease [Saprospiraceae bacterium]